MQRFQVRQRRDSITVVPEVLASVASVAGGALLGWSGYLHYHLWQSLGYRNIPIIGTLFVLQAVTGVALAAIVIGTRRTWASLLGAAFSASTVAGLIMSIDHGLFGFRDSWSAPFARQTFVIEIGAFLLLAGSFTLRLFGPRLRVTPHSGV